MGNNLMQTDLSVWGMYQHADIVVKCVMIGFDSGVSRHLGYLLQ
ncbi:biopolymer transport protein ExbB [Salmonella enterica subsp. enterica]|uniref:Biopolymer transport protein ExbB n=1 Tax=Salmonella enterica I TaxID=59201 RepID=A0A379WLP1_SALET|nr:biopolymer transport protein ExbB [Salmonella enterica subsp. enterica]